MVTICDFDDGYFEDDTEWSLKMISRRSPSTDQLLYHAIELVGLLISYERTFSGMSAKDKISSVLFKSTNRFCGMYFMAESHIVVGIN